MSDENLSHILFESSSGYALFERIESEEIGAQVAQVQEKLLDPSLFAKTVHLVAFAPFKSATEALENQNDVSEGLVSPFLKAFLEMNLPKSDDKKAKKKVKATLGVVEKSLASTIKTELGINCVSDDVVFELHRLLRCHAVKLLSSLKPHDLEKSQLGLGHAYSRAKVKFNVNRVDNMIIQAIALLDQLDKDINTFAMRVREWYGWHFPELVKLVNDNRAYCRVVTVLKNKGEFKESSGWNDLLEAVEQDETKARQVVEAIKSSMGTDISEVDLINIEAFANRVMSLTSYRTRLQGYLQDKMNNIAPNLSALIGEVVGARLISHAGSLTNLSKYPASTVQILGAEKALFRALKTRGNTPKYGLIYNSTFIGKAAQKNKGRISRFLANKCSIASRIDCFSDQPTEKFGLALRDLVDNRLAFYEKGAAPNKNADTMQKVISELAQSKDEEDEVKPKRARDEVEEDESNKEKKKKKKQKKTEEAAPEKEKPTKEEKPKKEEKAKKEPTKEPEEKKKKKKEKKPSK